MRELAVAVGLDAGGHSSTLEWHGLDYPLHSDPAVDGVQAAGLTVVQRLHQRLLVEGGCRLEAAGRVTEGAWDLAGSRRAH